MARSLLSLLGNQSLSSGRMNHKEFGGIPSSLLMAMSPRELAMRQAEKVVTEDQPGTADIDEQVKTSRNIAGPADNSEIMRLLKLAGYKFKNDGTSDEQGQPNQTIDLDQLKSKAIPDYEGLRQMIQNRPTEVPLRGLANIGQALSSTNRQMKFDDAGYTADDALKQETDVGALIQKEREGEMKRQSDLLRAITGITSVKESTQEVQDNKYKVMNPQPPAPRSGGKGETLKPPTAGEIEALSTAKAAVTAVDAAMKVVRKNKDLIGPGMGTYFSIGKDRDSGTLSSLAGKAISGLDPDAERAETIKAVIDAARQILGKPMEGGVLRLEDEIKYKQIIGDLSGNPKSVYIGLKNFRKELANRANERLRLMRSSKKFMGPEYDHYESTFNSFAGDDTKIANQSSAPSQQGKSAAPAAKPKTVRQNGHTYTLNPATGQYE